MNPLPADHETWDADRLEAEIREHNRRYWDDAAPIISDYDYDRLVERLRQLNPQAAVLQAMGPSDATRAGNAVTHQNAMLSLDKAYDEEALLKWADKFEGELVMTPKIDGVACSIRYAADGALVVAATRGSGVVGEDITANVLRIANVPKQLDAGVAVEVRGEVYLPLSRFAALEGQFANPRNTAAGALKQKNPDKSAQVGLRFYLYDVIGVEFDTEIHKFEWAAAHGFSPVEHQLVKRDQVQIGYEAYVARRAELDFEIDGVVFKADDLDEQRRLGHTSHHPRYAIAYKLQGDSAPTTLEQVEWSVSRNGILTPVGVVAPVKLSGATVTRISLHNWGLVQTKALSLGAEVVAMRRGGVIPYLEAVIKPGHTAITPPGRCPTGGDCVPRVEGDFVQCTSATGCTAQRVGILGHFAKALDIEGFGEIWLMTLVTAGKLRDPIDFFRLRPEDLIGFDRMGETLANKLVAEVQRVKGGIPLATFLQALGVPGLGRSASRTLAARCRSLEAVRALTVEEAVTLPKFGELLATQVLGGLSAKAELIDGLLAEGVQVLPDETPEDAGPVEGPLSGQSFLFTATLAAMKRGDAQERVAALGGTNASAVNKQLSYLVVGAEGKAGSKLTKAQKLGVPVLDEAAFLALLARSEDAEGAEPA